MCGLTDDAAQGVAHAGDCVAQDSGLCIFLLLLCQREFCFVVEAGCEGEEDVTYHRLCGSRDALVRVVVHGDVSGEE